MTEKRIKMNDGKGKDQEPNTAKVDRLSELPDPIIHYILSFVPTVDVVRMSILSKRWRRMWYSLPVLYFNDSADFGKSRSENLCRFVGQCFKLRKNDMLNVTNSAITKVKLSTGYSWSRISSWLRLVAKSNIKELDLEIPRSSRLRLPPEVLLSKSLTHIRFNCISLENLRSASLPSLISLSLESVDLDDQVLNNLLLGCSSLEKLLVKDCYRLSNPRVSTLSLRLLETDFYQDDLYEMFRVEAVNLESFVCRGSRTCSMSTLSSCGKLRNISFYRSRLDSQALDELVLRLSLLESLMLDNCDGLRHVKICSQHLKHINFKQNPSLCDESDVTIDSPNLVFFRFEGSPSLKISMNVKNLLEAYITLSPTRARRWPNDPRVVYDMSWYNSLLDFLLNLDCSKNMVLCIYSEEGLIIPDELRRARGAPLPTVKHLKVTTHRPLLRNPDLQASLFWALPSLEKLQMDTRT